MGMHCAWPLCLRHCMNMYTSFSIIPNMENECLRCLYIQEWLAGLCIRPCMDHWKCMWACHMQEVGDSGSLKLTATNGNVRLRIALSNDGAGRCASQALPRI